MTLFSLFLLAIIQGVTEFLPISSSAHLALLHQVNGSGEEDVALDVAVHLTTPVEDTPPHLEMLNLLNLPR